MYRQIVGSGGGSTKQDSRAVPWLLPGTEAAEQVPSEKWEMSQVLICATRPYARRIYAGESISFGLQPCQLRSAQ
jgi:hypothetical protein